MEIFEIALAQGLAPAIVVAIYLVIIKIIDSRKEKNKIKISSELINSINLISKYIVDTNKNIVDVDKQKCKNAINDAINGFELKMVHFVQTTIINNNIDINKDIIISNIHELVVSEYYNIYSTLNLYVINNKKVSELMDNSLIKDIESDMINIIYNKALTNEQKIESFANKINIKCTAHVVHMTNKILK